ncbi:recombinase family protein [Pseudoroseomonas ludipueritiae]|uniref:Recombinase family protein n=2 Tax=Pseudoroseomonas ludipueritiae TaxID=198093 RepID=A0ABR7RBA0_9PROT|nr:recombinase family protein [Pseudoroseomonas ludipueritiae]
MSHKITADHLARGAAVYVRQSTMAQVVGNTESKRRQYGLADQARAAGFVSVTVIDEDLGRSGSGVAERPGFARLVATVLAGEVGAVYCIEASRLARNGRDWHHLIDLCALAGTLVIDPDGAYDPRLVNDRLLLGLKGTMSEYELSLLRQRGIEARDGKARRGALRFTLPPGYVWSEDGRIEVDPDERVSGAIRMVFAKYRELGSARQLFLWARGAGLLLPVVQRNLAICRITWRAPAYHTVVQVLHNPLYAGAYAFARRGNRIRVENGRARKTSGHDRPMAQWGALIRDNHEGYITWAEFEENQRLFGENAHMQKRASRKAARGGRALLTGLVRCGRCGRMMRVFYGSGSGHAHRYQCRGDDAHVGAGLCIGIGGVRVDQAVTALMLEAVSGHAVEAAMLAAEKVAAEDDALSAALGRDLEAARYDASLAARRYDLVDPARRHVARELEARWNTALERVAVLERRIATAHTSTVARPEVDRDALMRLAGDLPAAWNAPTADNRARQRLTHILVREVVIDLDDATHEAVVIIHWAGGQHTEARVPRVRCKPRRAETSRSPAEVVRRLAQEWPDREIAVTLNRMRCRTSVGENWTSVTVREVRERLGVPPFQPSEGAPTSIGMQDVARRFGICIPSVLRLIREGILPAEQAMPYAPWKIPLEALATEPVLAGLRRVKERRPKNLQGYHRDETMRLPGL